MGIREMNDRIQIVQKTMKMNSFKMAAAKIQIMAAKNNITQ